MLHFRIYVKYSSSSSTFKISNHREIAFIELLLFFHLLDNKWLRGCHPDHFCPIMLGKMHISISETRDQTSSPMGIVFQPTKRDKSIGFGPAAAEESSRWARWSVSNMMCFVGLINLFSATDDGERTPRVSSIFIYIISVFWLRCLISHHKKNNNTTRRMGRHCGRPRLSELYLLLFVLGFCVGFLSGACHSGQIEWICEQQHIIRAVLSTWVKAQLHWAHVWIIQMNLS